MCHGVHKKNHQYTEKMEPPYFSICMWIEIKKNGDVFGDARDPYSMPTISCQIKKK